MVSLKIDFYIEVFKQLKNHVLSSGVISQEQHSIIIMEFTETNSHLVVLIILHHLMLRIAKFFCGVRSRTG